jgi:SAM-dependent methyltransferase
MEELPVEDASVDLVISNCVINLSPDKEAVFHEIARVLRPGGRMVVSDIVLTAQIPEDIRGDLALWGSCLGGALQESEYLATIASAGLAEPKVEARTTYGPEMIEDYLSGSSCACSAGSGARFSAVHRAALAGNVHSITVTAHRAVH